VLQLINGNDVAQAPPRRRRPESPTL